MPGIDSSLSSVPPVWPNPRPDIFASFAPQAATIGPRAILVLSPTPPVECLSTFTPLIDDKSMTSPLCSMRSVRVTISSLLIPLNKIAISNALTW